MSGYRWLFGIMLGMAVFWGLVVVASYNLGYLKGRGDLDGWMREARIERFKAVETCPSPTTLDARLRAIYK